MPRVAVDLEELRRFAAVLEHTVEELNQRKGAVSAKVTDLEGFWKDSKHANFAQIFEEMMGRLDAFLKASKEHIDFLRTKAKLGDPYNQHQYH